jgi:O-antigen/teichoic acid export membrane protein
MLRSRVSKTTALRAINPMEQSDCMPRFECRDQLDKNENADNRRTLFSLTLNQNCPGIPDHFIMQNSFFTRSLMIKNFFDEKLKFSDFGKVLMRYASAQIVSNFLKMLSGFLVVRLVEPEMYGTFSGVGVYMGYILLGHGGIINGLSRELPFALGQGNDEEAKKMASSVFFLSTIISVLAAFSFLFFGLYHLNQGNSIIGWIFIGYTIISGLNLMNSQFLPVLYRTNKDFDSLSKQDIRFGLGNLVSVALVWLLGFWGLVIRGTSLAIYQFMLLYINKPYKLELKYRVSDYKSLLKTGIPIFLVGHVNPIWTTVLNNLIFSIGGALNFGLYAISNIVMGAIGVIPSAFSQVIYPRMAIMLGQGVSVINILKQNVKPLFFQGGIMVSLGIVTAWLLPYIVPVLLPKYVDGIKAAQWMVFVPAVQSFGALNNIYNVVKKQGWYFFSLITGALFGTAYILLMYRANGFELEVFPQGIILGTAIQQFFSILFIFRLR